MKDEKSRKEPTFEEALERLEQIVKAMEEGRLTLDQMTRHFEEANELARFCDAKLNEVERKIDILTRREETGKGREEPFEADEAASDALF
jgi:exodeoxyribonuclease VII small subunit